MQNQLVLRELEKISTIEQLQAMQLRYKAALLQSAKYFESQASSLELPEEKRIAQHFVSGAGKILQEAAEKR